MTESHKTLFSSAACLPLGNVCLAKSLLAFYGPQASPKGAHVAALFHTGQGGRDPGEAAGTGEGMGRGPVFGDMGSIRGEDRGRGSLLGPWLLGAGHQRGFVSASH